MKHDFMIVLEKKSDVVPLAQCISFCGTTRQADKVFCSLSFALVLSHYEQVTLFMGDKQIKTTTFKR